VTDQERTLLLSLRPLFADRILTGTKTVELRRQRVATPPGIAVLLYATAPVMSVVATARVAAAHTGEPEQIWLHFRDELGLTATEFHDYVTGATRATALQLTHVQALPTHLSLAHLRAMRPFHPPQSYRYLTYDLLCQLVRGHPVASHLLAILRN
jgi:predicted transcriptional regulator